MLPTSNRQFRPLLLQAYARSLETEKVQNAPHDEVMQADGAVSPSPLPVLFLLRYHEHGRSDGLLPTVFLWHDLYATLAPLSSSHFCWVPTPRVYGQWGP